MKLKTRKSVSKKFSVTKTGKVKRQFSKQNHANSKETGAFGRKKKRAQFLKGADRANVLRALSN
ncbi:MAG: 50S ribosomal protein L35 [Candidatus Moraniibacteriota bacterium]|nr:MAG: 50S ribosomal protein L35 [Candidatus Moranbacteria bacterium]